MSTTVMFAINFKRCCKKHTRVSFYLDPFISPQMKPEGLKFGDMKFTPKQRDALRRGEDMGMTHGHGYAAVNDNNLRWKDAVIPYVIDCSIGEFENVMKKENWISNRLTDFNVQFSLV